MDEKNDWSVSLPTIFFVTAFSFLIFNFVTKILEGSYAPLLFRIALIAGGLGIITLILSRITVTKKQGDTTG